ncbi:Chitin synthase, class 7 [Naganishia adeliensis]|uniref:Chitin synthase, class 7 n=1 Tax=Naganishia adeliensis TaxID=92952 RepID=A0ACC2VNG1_9TREE|nr:Chitin synthase, class 7 [Naganishia adeliensis]
MGDISPSAPIKFGSFEAVCEHAALLVCPLLHTPHGVEPDCYGRNIQLGSQLIFQPGRKEILLFFYLYFLISLLAIFLDSAIIPTANVVYPWFSAIYAGLVAALYWCLLVNGFVGFQWAEDGTPMSLWFIRISTTVVGVICFLVTIGTFKNVALKYDNPIGLWITYLIYPAVCVVIYTVSQLILVIRTLDDRWAIGHILFGLAFYVIGVVLLLAFSNTICESVSHYLDGVFFFQLCMLFSVMMVYKYWDSITREDLEFSVGSKASVWEVKDPLLPPNLDYVDEDQSAYHGGGGSLVGGVSGNSYYGNVGSLPRSNTYGASNLSQQNARYQPQGGNSGGYGS